MVFIIKEKGERKGARRGRDGRKSARRGMHSFTGQGSRRGPFQFSTPSSFYFSVQIARNFRGTPFASRTTNPFAAPAMSINNDWYVAVERLLLLIVRRKCFSLNHRVSVISTISRLWPDANSVVTTRLLRGTRNNYSPIYYRFTSNVGSLRRPASLVLILPLLISSTNDKKGVGSIDW